MATLDEIADGYVSAEDEDFVPDAAVMQDHAAAVARQARANQALSTRELVQQRKAKASAAAAWAALKAGDDADVEPALAPGAEPPKAKAKKAKKKPGKGKKAKKSGAKLQAVAGAGEGGSDATDPGAGGGSDPARATKKKTKGKKRPRDAAAILQQLNRGPTKRKADSAKVLSSILGGQIKRRAVKKQRVSRVAMPTGGRAAVGKVVVSDIVKFAGKAIRVTKTMDAAEAHKLGSAAVPTSAGARSSGIDSAVAALENVHKVNTVEKSSMDWDTYKVESGLGDEVEAAAKNGFVGRQEFLERVDHRQYALEVEDRKRQRAAAAAAAGK